MNHDINLNLLSFIEQKTEQNIIGGFLSKTGGSSKTGGQFRNYYDQNALYDYNRRRYNPHQKMDNNSYLSTDDFEETSLNKYEIEVYIELTNKTLSTDELACYARKQKMIYNAKTLFSVEHLYDFTKIANMDLYSSDMDLSKIKPYLDLSYNKK
jgi:hypothetical protein